MRTWKGTTAGVLTIIGGIFGIATGAYVIYLGSGGLFAGNLLLGIINSTIGIPGMSFLAGIGGLFVAFGLIALIGGIFALRRKVWGFALTGAIFSLFPLFFLGIPAIIFVALAKKEFD